jgi:hypothetical protein
MPELTRRYVVMTMAAAAPFDPSDHDVPFVLKPWKDPAALAALRAYRDHCYPELASDLDAWIRVIESGPTVRGDVGQRNEAHLAASSAARARAARRAAATGKGGAARRKASARQAANRNPGGRRVAAKGKGAAGPRPHARSGRATPSPKSRKRR